MNVFLNIGFNLLKDSMTVLDFLNGTFGGFSVVYLCSIAGLITIFGLCIAHLVADW